MASTKKTNVVVSEPPRFLNDKELRFCIEYSVSRNATQAYQRAYKCGYNSAKAHGCELLQDVTVRQYIDEMTIERNERLKIDADDTLRKIKILSEYDASDFYDDDGRLKPLSELHPDLRFVIEGMDVSEKVTGDAGDGLSILKKIKLPRKKDALELLAKCQYMLCDKPKDEDDTPPPPTRVEIIVKDARQ